MGVPVSFSENYVTSLALKGLALDDADDEVAELVAIVLQLVAQAVDGLSISEAWPPAQSVGEQFLDKEYGLERHQEQQDRSLGDGQGRGVHFSSLTTPRGGGQEFGAVDQKSMSVCGRAFLSIFF